MERQTFLAQVCYDCSMTNDELSKLLDEKLKAVKADIQTIKEDLKKTATKQDVQDQIRWAEQRLSDQIENKIEKPFYTYRNEIMTKIDGLAGRLLKQDQKDTIHDGQHERLSDIPERVENLEKIHPGGQHPH